MSALIATSIFGNMIIMIFTAARVKQEIAKEGIPLLSLSFATGVTTPAARLWTWLKRDSKGSHQPIDDLDHQEQTPRAALAQLNSAHRRHSNNNTSDRLFNLRQSVYIRHYCLDGFLCFSWYAHSEVGSQPALVAEVTLQKSEQGIDLFASSILYASQCLLDYHGICITNAEASIQSILACTSHRNHSTRLGIALVVLPSSIHASFEANTIGATLAVCGRGARQSWKVPAAC